MTSNRSEAWRRGPGQREKCELLVKRSEWRKEETLSLSVEDLQHLKAEAEDDLAKQTKQEE